MLMTYRPRICPFHRLLEQVPKNSSVLDIGCGNGLWLLLLAELGQIRRGIGLDISIEKIQLAEGLKRPDMPLDFRPMTAGQAWPKEAADCVTLIDVIHHIPPDDQKPFVQSIDQTGTRLLIVKDIDPTAFWKSAANTLHDLALSGQRPRYCSPSVLCEWLHEVDFEIQLHARCDMLWYSHFMIVARKRIVS